MKIPQAKIEERAISTLRNIIDKHPTMNPDFDSMDKKMSWDGFIWIFTGETEQSKDAYDDKVSVQIKGHIDRENKYFSKEKITYPVEVADLKVYFKGTGTIYFLVFMTEDGKKREIYYASLFPSKIKRYLQRVEEKMLTKTISIPFRRLKQTPEDFYIVVKQFSIECKKQGFGGGPIGQNTIEQKEIEEVDTITAVVVGASTDLEICQRMETGDVCIYGKTKNGKIARPLEWNDDAAKTFREKMERAVEIKRTVDYI